MRAPLTLLGILAVGLLVGYLFGSNSADRVNGDVESRDDDSQATTSSSEDVDTYDDVRSPVSGSATPTLEGVSPSSNRASSSIDRQAWALGLLDQGYADNRRIPDAIVPAELRDAATEGALAHASRSIEHYSAWLRGYVDGKKHHGELGATPRIRMEARGTGTANLDPGLVRQARGIAIRKTPLELTLSGGRSDVLEVFIDGGVPPLDQALVIERIDVEAMLGTMEGADNRPTWSGSSCEVSIDGTSALLRRTSTSRKIHGTLRGRHVFRQPFQPPRLAVAIRSAVARVTAHGRFVPMSELKAWHSNQYPDVPFRWTTQEDDGLINGPTVTLQAFSGYRSGGVRLNGSVSDIQEVRSRSIWNEAVKLRGKKVSMAWTSGAGVIPQGKVYRVTRIDWRAKFFESRRNKASFVVRWRHMELVKHTSSDSTEASGSYDEEIYVFPGNETAFAIECSSNVLGEVVLIGTLENPPADASSELDSTSGE